MSEEKKGTSLARREELEGSETQVITKVEGVEITVNRHGRFLAIVDEVEIHGTKLQGVIDRVKAAKTTLIRKAKKEAAKPVFVLTEEASLPDGHVFFMGLHGGNGDIMIRTPNGVSERIRSAAIFRRDDHRIPRMEELKAIKRRLRRDLRDIEDELKEIRDAQEAVMWEGIDGAGRRSWGGERMFPPRISNDPTKAFDVGHAMIKNVFGKDP